MHPRFPMPPEPGLFWAAGKIAAIQLACLAAMLALASALLPTHDATAEEAAGKKNVRELHERYQQQIPRLAAPCSADRVVLEAKSFEGTRKPSRPELIGQRFFVTRYGEDPRESDPQRQDQYYRIEGPAGVFYLAYLGTKPRTTAGYAAWQEGEFSDHDVAWKTGSQVPTITLRDAFVAPFSGPLLGIAFEIVGCRS